MVQILHAYGFTDSLATIWAQVQIMLGDKRRHEETHHSYWCMDMMAVCSLPQWSLEHSTRW
jgi:hypothetical protein